MTDEQICEQLDKAIAQEMIAMWFLVQKALEGASVERGNQAMALHITWQPRFAAMLNRCKDVLNRNEVFPDEWMGF